MAIPFEQLVAATYDDVVTEKNKAADQWSDSTFLKTLEKIAEATGTQLKIEFIAA